MAEQRRFPTGLIISGCVGLVCVFLTGCVPSNIVWVPDSSAIIYTEKSGSRLVRYDLAKNARKILVADTKARTPWPAISKDGKKLAVADYKFSLVKGSKQASRKFSITVYDSLDGSQVSQTKVHAFTTDLPEPSTITSETQDPVGLNWSGPSDKLIISLDRYTDGIYDLKKEKFTAIHGQAWPWFNRPVRPDGKGFIAMLSGKGPDDNKFVFYDWDGWETNLGKFPLPEEGKDEGLAHMAWEKNVYRIFTTARTIEADTEKNKITEAAANPWYLPTKGKLTLAFPFADSDSKLCFFTQKISDEKSLNWAEIQRPSLKQRKVLLSSDDYKGIDALTVFPSPDNKLVAIRCLDSKSNERILVIDAKGAIVTDIAVDN